MKRGELLNMALVFAATKHSGQFDRGGHPYILHPLKVFYYLKSDDEELQCIALLHDVVEDCGVTFQELLDMGFTKRIVDGIRGLTKDVDSRVARPQQIGKRFGASLTGHTEETKQKLSKFRTEWLRNPDNRKNLGRHKRSWMELTFESYLKENNIVGWDTEIHFWNDELKKNYFPDFIFEELKLIIELDGTQHRNTIEKDAIRDEWFNDKGYKVIRIPHPEFKERYFSGKGFLDLLRG